eukprot:4551752-Prymnesium_polylepis.2
MEDFLVAAMAAAEAAAATKGRGTLSVECPQTVGAVGSQALHLCLASRLAAPLRWSWLHPKST